MSANPYFGWELLYRTVENDVRNSRDILTAFVHWMLVRNSFHCLGSGEDKIIRESDVESETLPKDWNCDESSYSLRYIYDNDLMVLHCITLDDNTSLFNLLNVNKSIVSNVNFEYKETVVFCKEGPKKYRLTDLIPKIDIQMARVKTELIDPAVGISKPNPEIQKTNQTTDEGNSSRNLSMFNVSREPSNERPLREPFRDVGRADLDPFNQGGGMLFTLPNPLAGPPMPSGLPRHAVPPGARFDPFMPFNPNAGRFGPNPDHLRAPGYEDDMFS